MLLLMRYNGSLGYRSHKTSYYSYRRQNDDEESSEEEVLEVYLGEESCGNRSIDNRQCSSSNCGVCESREHGYQVKIHSNLSNCGDRGHRSSMTSHYASRNSGGYVDRGGYRSQETIHSYSRNQGTMVDVEGRGGYMSQTSHYSSPNLGERGIWLTFSGDNIGGDGRVGYRSHNRHYLS